MHPGSGARKLTPGAEVSRVSPPANVRSSSLRLWGTLASSGLVRAPWSRALPPRPCPGAPPGRQR